MADKCTRQKGRDVVQYETVEDKLEREFHEARRKGELVETPHGDLVFPSDFPALKYFNFYESTEYSHYFLPEHRYQTTFGYVTELNVKQIPVYSKFLEKFSDLKKLRKLDLTDIFITSNNIHTFPELSELTHLKISSNYLFDEDLTNLTSLKNLISLDLSYNHGLTNNSLEHIAQLENLEELKMWWTRVGTEGYLQLKERLPNLKTFNYGFN